jgi:chemotaxis receptor (MCP) glutamine deamidase CheD
VPRRSNEDGAIGSPAEAGAADIDGDDLFRRESRGKKTCFVHVNDSLVCDESNVLYIDLGSCVSVVLCGVDERGRAWLGANHLFKSRIENSDMALEQVAHLYHRMTDNGVLQVKCLGLFGAGYRERSLAKDVAQLNVRTILEALSLFNLTVEIFQTGYAQAVRVLKSNAMNSFLILHRRISERTSRVIEIPLEQIFRQS